MRKRKLIEKSHIYSSLAIGVTIVLLLYDVINIAFDSMSSKALQLVTIIFNIVFSQKSSSKQLGNDKYFIDTADPAHVRHVRSKSWFSLDY